jgi:hypothetical protein
MREWGGNSKLIVRYTIRPQHFLYCFPLPQGPGSFRPTFDPLEGAGMDVPVDFEGACAVLESCEAERLFHRPHYEML